MEQLSHFVAKLITIMSQELKRRVNTDRAYEKRAESDVKDDLVTLEPDFAIKIFYKYDPKTRQTDNESEASLKVLSKILQLNGFIVSIRPDSNTNFMILFVTLKEKSFAELVNLSNETDKLFNVAPNPTSNEKTSVAERLRLIHMKLTLPKLSGGCEIQVGKGNVIDILPVKSAIKLEKESKSNWKNFGKLFKKKTRDQNELFLKETLGSKYAIYYKFVQAYVSSIGCLAFIGVFARYFLGNFSVLYAIANVFIGLTCYVCIYATEKKLANEWNLSNISKTEIIKLEETDLIPTWKVLLRKLLFTPITLGGASGLFSIHFGCFLLEIFINEIYKGPFQSILALLPTILVCVLVPVGTMIYGIVAKKYLLFEKNPTQESENDSLLIKMFVFNCLASYSPLMITAFIYLPLGYALDPYLQTIQAMVTKASSVYSYIPNIPVLQSQYKVNNTRMASQIFYFMVTNQVVGTFVEFVVPIIVSKVTSIPKIASLLGTPASNKELKMIEIDAPEEHKFLELVRADFKKPEVSIDDDYRQHVLQYGFLMFFGPVWTLGALCCFVFGLIQQEGDYLKYIKLAKPAVPARAESSQPWILFMRFLLVIGSFVSVAITLMYNNDSSMGEEISSYVGRSSVDNSWIYIIGGSTISCITVQAVVWSSETVIDHIYDVDDSEELSKEIKARNLLSTLVKPEEGSAVTDVAGIMEEAAGLQRAF